MGLHDWLAEPFRGPVGDLQVGQRLREDQSRGDVLACAAVVAALLILVGAVVLIAWGGGVLAVFIMVAGLYLPLGYIVHPEPDTSNLGWLGGLMNDPFHVTDNVNRQLLLLYVFLLPVRFVAESLVDVSRLLRRRKIPNSGDSLPVAGEDADWRMHALDAAGDEEDATYPDRHAYDRRKEAGGASMERDG